MTTIEKEFTTVQRKRRETVVAVHMTTECATGVKVEAAKRGISVVAGKRAPLVRRNPRSTSVYVLLAPANEDAAHE